MAEEEFYELPFYEGEGESSEEEVLDLVEEEEEEEEIE